MAIRESFDTLSSTGSYDSFYSTDDEPNFLLDGNCVTCPDCDGRVFSPRPNCEHGKISQELVEDDTLDEDIKRWEAAAALYSDDDIVRTREQEQEQDYIIRRGQSLLLAARNRQLSSALQTTLDEDITLWEAAAAHYLNEEDNSTEYWTSFGDSESQEIAAQYAEQEKDDILRMGNSLLHSAHTEKLLSAFPEYVVPGVITLRSIDLCIGYYMELLEEHPWLEEYIDFLYIHKNIFSAQKQCEEIEDKAEQAEQEPVCNIGMSNKVINQSCAARGRKERKRKFNHKTKNSRGKTIESAKKIAKKPYPSWRKKKTGREHAETLVPREKDEFLKDVYEVYKLKYPKTNWPDLFDPSCEEANIAFWKYKKPVLTLYGIKRLML